MTFISQIVLLLRLNNPIGIFLLFYPCGFGLCLAASSHIDFRLMSLFFLGSVIMRTAGSVINDIFDQDFDKSVERTKNRPLASGALSNLDAIIILFILLFCGLLVLVQLPVKSILIALASMPIVIIYPLCKRFIYFPQLVLAIVWKIGILVAFMSVKSEITFPAILAYLGCIFWTLGYDTIYAFADIIDDKKIGIKSLAIFIEKKEPKIWITIFYVLFILLMAISSYLSFKLNFYMIFCYIVALFLLFRQVKLLDISGHLSNISLFKSNFLVGLVIVVGMIFTNLS